MILIVDGQYSLIFSLSMNMEILSKIFVYQCNIVFFIDPNYRPYYILHEPHCIYHSL